MCPHKLNISQLQYHVDLSTLVSVSPDGVGNDHSDSDIAHLRSTTKYILSSMAYVHTHLVKGKRKKCSFQEGLRRRYEYFPM